jgi:hypothetical protein
MKKKALSIGAFVAIIVGAYIALNSANSGPAVNPDPNHTHADFAVWLPYTSSQIEKMDYSDEKFMSEAYEEGKQVRVDPMRKYLHLHDGNGNVIHRHKPGLTIGQFFESIGSKMIKGPIEENGRMLDTDCFDTGSGGPVFCSGEFGRDLQMYVNETKVDFDPSYVFKDNDRVLIIFSIDENEVQTALDDLSNDACLYSQTCPERGDPPTENCIADPEVPCVIPEE